MRGRSSLPARTQRAMTSAGAAATVAGAGVPDPAVRAARANASMAEIVTSRDIGVDSHTQSTGYATRVLLANSLAQNKIADPSWRWSGSALSLGRDSGVSR